MHQGRASHLGHALLAVRPLLAQQKVLERKLDRERPDLQRALRV